MNGDGSGKTFPRLPDDEDGEFEGREATPAERLAYEVDRLDRGVHLVKRELSNQLQTLDTIAGNQDQNSLKLKKNIKRIDDDL